MTDHEQINAIEMAGEDPLSPLFSLLAKHFYKPDFQALRIVLGTMQAHYLSIGDPAWLFVVAPPGSGKTSISIMMGEGLPEVLEVGDITENSFLSGMHGANAPGMLEKLGKQESDEKTKTYTTRGDALILIKDFTTVLSMRREKRAAILSQLREIHDGKFRRVFGTGSTKVWEGRIGIIAAVTPALDRHYSMFSVLGERFLQLRWHRPDSEEAGEWAMRQQGREGNIKGVARNIVGNIFKKAARIAPPISPEMQHALAALAELVAIARTHIFRNGGNRDIEYVPEAEANTRIAKGLAGIARGISAVLRHAEVEETEFEDIVRIGFDCIPENRRRILQALRCGQSIEALGLPDTVRRREVEDLEALGLVTETEDEGVKLSARTLRLLEKAGLLTVKEGSVTAA